MEFEQKTNNRTRITNQVQDAGKVLEIPLLNHIILTAEGYLSFADEGFL
ncbi:MAG: JAB domain-containing protein [Bacteroidota bacterium]|nr:JAB domain-containing protein [Bacteroidota bacterium]